MRSRAVWVHPIMRLKGSRHYQSKSPSGRMQFLSRRKSSFHLVVDVFALILFAHNQESCRISQPACQQAALLPTRLLRLRGGEAATSSHPNVESEAYGFYKLLGIERDASDAV